MIEIDYLKLTRDVNSLFEKNNELAKLIYSAGKSNGVYWHTLTNPELKQSVSVGENNKNNKITLKYSSIGYPDYSQTRPPNWIELNSLELDKSVDDDCCVQKVMDWLVSKINRYSIYPLPSSSKIKVGLYEHNKRSGKNPIFLAGKIVELLDLDTLFRIKLETHSEQLTVNKFMAHYKRPKVGDFLIYSQYTKSSIVTESVFNDYYLVVS